MKVSIAVYGRFHAFNLAQQLHKNGFLNHLITTYPTYKASEFGIDSHNIKSLLYLEILSRGWSKLPNWLKSDRNLQLFWLEWFDRNVTKNLQRDFDIFVGWSGACLWSFRRAKELGALTIVERGSSHMQYQTEILQEEYERWGLKFTVTHPGVYERELQAYQECDRIAVPSLFVKRTFLEKGIPESKLIHVPYGVSLSEFYPVAKEDQTFRVIHCGGITLRKGVQYLLQAFYELNLPDAELWLVGSVDLEMNPFLAKYKSDKIILKGKQPQNQLRWFYSQCSVFCIASIEEGLAMVQPQAIACGLPVIHTTNTGGEDIVRDGVDGFCVPIRDVEALKAKILYFYENPDKRDEMGNNALKQAKISLSWDDYGEKVINVYSKLLS
ncbi:MAG: glycosyltransferase family 4 protein [Cuspidothrix sp.]|jgi:glycosyltransferase involved in cell wall biosynthesis|uniref:Glycosyltransferase family 1 protein n=1 Tax=Cuspidothrix issatschenkoi CHARLIE-1 TaxID=2052836 RepID=A0A2S6CWR9_9CYAN|nr:glycosyltransferase family 4 protein [Cuspidothrix issatschenkoi]PPJ64030.1 glycosyltransferase family 1 protein [Cuspidothrix issatschenkoi CHARLIE-1]